MPGVKGRSGGQNRKTTAELKATGGYRKDRHGSRAEFKAGKPKKPSHLGENGSKTWARVLDSLPKEAVSALDTDALTMFCDMIDLYYAISPQVQADPLDKDLSGLLMKTSEKIDRLGRQFGWTPQSRAGIQVKAAPEEPESDPMEFILNRMGASKN